jgi:hypothetical protein
LNPDWVKFYNVQKIKSDNPINNRIIGFFYRLSLSINSRAIIASTANSNVCNMILI